MTHPDDKFRHADCPKCKELEKDLQEKQALLLMYREQIKQLQQSGVQLWSLQK